MDKTLKYYFNPALAAITIAGVLIPPQDGRDVPAWAHPDGNEGDGSTPLEEPALPDPDANFRDLLKANLKTLTPTLETHSDETLVALARVEGQSETPRKTLLGAIAELQLQRAQAKTGSAPE